MRVPVKSNIEIEIKKFLEMIPWLQRGNIKEISFKPNHPAVIIYRSIEEAADGKPVTVRLVKRDQRLFLVIDELEVDVQIQKFHYEFLPDSLMGYLLDRRPGERVSKSDISGAVPIATEVPINEAFRKMKHWKVFKHYFVPICTKHTMQIVDQITMSPKEAKTLLQAFGIKWQDPEEPN